MQTDERLQQQLKDLSNENNQVQVSKVIEVAANNGYKFSQEDITQLTKEKLSAMVENGELSEEEMESVAGGGYDLLLTKIDQIDPTFVPEIMTGIDINRDGTEDQMVFVKIEG